MAGLLAVEQAPPPPLSRRDAELAKRANEAARKQADRDREQQKAIDAAAAELKSAEALSNPRGLEGADPVGTG